MRMLALHSIVESHGGGIMIDQQSEDMESENSNLRKRAKPPSEYSYYSDCEESDIAAKGKEVVQEIVKEDPEPKSQFESSGQIEGSSSND